MRSALGWTVGGLGMLVLLLAGLAGLLGLGALVLLRDVSAALGWFGLMLGLGVAQFILIAAGGWILGDLGDDE